MGSPTPNIPRLEGNAGEESRTARKMRDNPLMVIGLAGWVGVVAYGLYGIKNRKQSLAMHLIHTRVIAQACVVSALSLGVGYKLYTEHFAPYMGWAEKPDKPSQF